MNSSPHQGQWEQRWHPLRQEWIVYSAHRNARPWLGSVEQQSNAAPAYDPQCYLCPGNLRISGARNPDYTDTFVFDNDHPVVGEQAPEIAEPTPPLFARKRADGIARVVCFDPRHNVTLTEMPRAQVTNVFRTLREQMRELREIENIKFVLIFENKGEIVGVSNPHPHCQIYATNFVFKYIETELRAAQSFRRDHDHNIFEKILRFEAEQETRIVVQNEHAVAFVPFFARYAYEAWIFPKQRHATLSSMSDEELDGLAAVYQDLTRRYDLLYNMSFPYVMTFYQAPVDGGDYSDYHLHLVLLPPLRQPGIKKFLAGPEIGGGNFMADTMPEEKAAELRRITIE